MTTWDPTSTVLPSIQPSSTVAAPYIPSNSNRSANNFSNYLSYAVAASPSQYSLLATSASASRSSTAARHASSHPFIMASSPSSGFMGHVQSRAQEVAYAQLSPRLSASWILAHSYLVTARRTMRRPGLLWPMLPAATLISIPSSTCDGLSVRRNSHSRAWR